MTPQPQVGQQGPAWIRWLDRYAQEHAAAAAQSAVRDFPPMVRAQITQEADGETMTPSTMQLIVTLLARLGAAHGLRQVPLTREEMVVCFRRARVNLDFQSPTVLLTQSDR